MKNTKQTPGHAFRVKFLDAYESDDVVDLTLLDQAAATLDEIAALTDALEHDGVVSTGSQGQPVPHPALKALVAHRASFFKMCRDLEPGGSTRKAGSALAIKRWRS